MSNDQPSSSESWSENYDNNPSPAASFESRVGGDELKDAALPESVSGEPTPPASSAPEVTAPVPTNSETTAPPKSESETSSQPSSEASSQEDTSYSQEKTTQGPEQEALANLEKDQTTEIYSPYQPSYSPAPDVYASPTTNYGQPANYEQQAPAYGAPAPSGYQGSAPSYHPAAPSAGQPYHYNNGAYSAPQQITNSDTPLFVLLLGVGGLLFPFISFAAWYMGGKAKQEFAARGVNDSMLNVGYILGIIGSVFQILFIFFILMMVIVSVTAATGVA